MGYDDQTAAWLSSVLAQHGRALVLYARQWCECPEDVVQEALLELVSQRQAPDRVAAWLFRVVRNGAISAGRSAHRRKLREQQAAATEACFENTGSALDAMAASEALSTLPPDLREVLVARIWGELTFSEIAEVSGTSTSTAQRRYEQGLRELQARLEKPCTTNRSTPS
jgi:RNA polymerase sigma-70 factor (ECF subfamily)